MDTTPKNVRHAAREFAEMVVTNLLGAYWEAEHPEKFIVAARALIALIDDTAPPMPTDYEVFNPGGPGGKGWATADEPMVLISKALLNSIKERVEFLDDQTGTLDEVIGANGRLYDLLTGQKKP